MDQNQDQDQHSRTRLLIGEERLCSLQESRVLVCGLGAVGSVALEGLARGGAGFFRLVDFDCFDLSNINRQVLAAHSTNGQSKVRTAATRVKDINPAVLLEEVELFIDEQTIPVILKDIDIVVDAIDSVNSKVSLVAAAKASGIPVVSSMGAAGRLDPYQVQCADIGRTFGCPLARVVRKKLSALGIKKGVRSVFSPEKVSGETLRPDTDCSAPDGRKGPGRSTLGSISYLTAVFGMCVAAEAMQLIWKQK